MAYSRHFSGRCFARFIKAASLLSISDSLSPSRVTYHPLHINPLSDYHQQFSF
jgi:hypothetical protein